MASFRHTFPKPFRAMPYVLASVNGFVQDAADPGLWDCINGSFVVSIRSTGRAGFSANIYRVDSSPESMTDGWHGPIVVHYIAWDYFQEESSSSQTGKAKGRVAGERGREGEVGVLFGTWDVEHQHPPPVGAPWVPPAGELPNSHYYQDVTAHNPPFWPEDADARGGAEAGRGGAAELESELAAYGGGQPEVVRVHFGTRFGEAPRVIVGSRITSPYDRQAVLALTVRSVDTTGFDVNVARVDNSWAVQALSLDYIAWLPSHDMATGDALG